MHGAWDARSRSHIPNCILSIPLSPSNGLLSDNSPPESRVGDRVRVLVSIFRITDAPLLARLRRATAEKLLIPVELMGCYGGYLLRGGMVSEWTRAISSMLL